jgi:beta-lactam-binding protein with PASTA domain
MTEPGVVVWLTLYTAQVEQTGAEEDSGAPRLTGLFWKDAQKQLETAGIKVKFVPGKNATNEEDIFKVYEQEPAAGVALKNGETIVLKLYNRPGTKQ